MTAYLRGVMAENPFSLAGAGWKEKLWLTLANQSFEMTCRLRNLLRIGL